MGLSKLKGHLTLFSLGNVLALWNRVYRLLRSKREGRTVLIAGVGLVNARCYRPTAASVRINQTFQDQD